MDRSLETFNLFIPLFLFMSGVQFIWPLSFQQHHLKGKDSRKLWRTNLVLTFLAILSAVLTFLFLLRVCTFFKVPSLPGVISLPSPLRILLANLVIDALAFGMHYARHNIGFLWRVHRVHHIDTHVNTSTAVKAHPFEMMLATLCSFSGIYALGLTPFEASVVTNIITFFTIFAHTDVRLPLFLERLLSVFFFTPRSHLIHHQDEKQNQKKNYGVVFNFWDRLVGTYARIEDSPSRYGLKDYADVENGVWDILPLSLKKKTLNVSKPTD